MRAAAAARLAAVHEQRVIRLLDALGSTFPAWDIGLERDFTGQTWWMARLCRHLTQDIGVLRDRTARGR